MTEVASTGRVGPDVLADGAQAKIRQGKSAEVIVSELHGRFYEQNYRGNVYCGGMGITSISNSTFTTATLTASMTPIAGVFNPATSQYNVVLLQVSLCVVQTALQATGCGGFVWASSVGNTAISTGTTPLNRKTLVTGGASARDMTNVTPTGLTNNLTVKFGSALNGGSAVATAFLATQVALQTQAVTSSVENFDGGLIVPPGGILSLLCGTTPVGHSAASAIVWEEVPL